MAIKKVNAISFAVISMLLTSIAFPAYAEVDSLQTDSLSYIKEDIITFSGKVEEGTNGVVSIVIRDSNDKFVYLIQTSIRADNTFEKSVETDKKFLVTGIYNTTAFIQNMSAGALTLFDFSVDGSIVSPSVSDFLTEPADEVDSTTVEEIEPIPKEKIEPTSQQVTIESETINELASKIASFVDTSLDPQHYIDRYNNEPAYKEWFDKNYPTLNIEEAVGIHIEPEEEKTSIPGFPDPEKDPQHYIDRYNNEPAYKEWFDKNFVGQSIYKVVGVPESEIVSTVEDITENDPVISTQNSLPNSVESSTVNSVNSEVSQMLLALGGLGVLFGAVYGIKRRVDSNYHQIAVNKTALQKRVDSNSDQIFQNRFWLKSKLINRKKCDEPVTVIKERLAKGEISVDEYYKLLRALKKQ